MNCQDIVITIDREICITIHVIPNASQNRFPVGYNVWRKCIEMRITSEAKDNKANEEIINTLAKFFALSSNDIYIKKGKRNRIKTVALKNISLSEVCNKLRTP
jgi:hypothetical protein